VWPTRLPAGDQQRELVLKLELYTGCPAGLAERFALDAHRFGTALCSWMNGVVLRSVRGPVACAERVANDLFFRVRFDPQSELEQAAAWSLLSAAKQMLEEQRAKRFFGLLYDARMLCEKCVKDGTAAPAGEFRSIEEGALSEKQVCERCGHTFELGAAEKKALRQHLPTVLIVTTADVEREAVMDRLDEKCPTAIGRIPVKIGSFGGRVVAVCQTRQGVN